MLFREAACEEEGSAGGSGMGLDARRMDKVRACAELGPGTLKHWQLVPEKRTPHTGSDAAREMAAADDEETLIKDGAHVRTNTHTQAQTDRDKKKKACCWTIW